MTRQIRWMRFNFALALSGAALLVGGLSSAWADSSAKSPTVAPQQIEMFSGMRDGRLDVKIVARNDRAARVFITNNSDQPVSVQLPEAFAAVPALAQFGGGGAGGGGGRSTTTGGGNQSAGGGFGGGGQGGGGGGGGGLFSVPPEETGKIDVALVCLDHGLRDPSSSKPYKIVPADEHLDRPAVIELLKAFGRGELQHGAAQAAVWHLNSDMNWQQLAAKLQGTRRNFRRPPYFSPAEIRAGMAYAHEATRRAQSAEQTKPPADDDDKSADERAAEERSEARSTQD